MASLVGSGSTKLVYTDDNNQKSTIVVAHIVEWNDQGENMINVETTAGSFHIKLDNQAAVDAAATLIDGLI